MKTLPTILAAALIAASGTVALAQGNTAQKPGTGLDADANPSAVHNPAAWNPAGTKWVKHGKRAMIQPKMKTSHVSARPMTRHVKHKMMPAGTTK